MSGVDLWSVEQPTIQVGGKQLELRFVTLRTLPGYNALAAAVGKVLGPDGIMQGLEAEGEHIARALSKVLLFDEDDPLDWPAELAWEAALRAARLYANFQRTRLVETMQAALDLPEMAAGDTSLPGSADVATD